MSREWSKDDLQDVHRRIIESGLFDRIPHAEYAIGDIVAIRDNATVHGIREIHDDLFLLNDGNSTREVARGDIRPANGYVQVAGQIIHSDKEWYVDRHGHGTVTHRK